MHLVGGEFTLFEGNGDFRRGRATIKASVLARADCI